MATKIKRRKKSKFPDKSPAARIYSKAVRDTCNQYEDTVTDLKVRGMEDMLIIILYVLRSKYHSSDEDLEQLSRDISEHAGYIRDGKLTLEMIKEELKNVYNVEI